jgi:hypothetical protein
MKQSSAPKADTLQDVQLEAGDGLQVEVQQSVRGYNLYVSVNGQTIFRLLSKDKITVETKG